MNLDTIKSKAGQLTTLHKQTELYRQEWQDTTKPRLIEVLSSIQDEVKIGWLRQTVDYVKNLENVNLQFRDRSSGIIVRDTESGNNKNLLKEGAKLVFAQTVNGEIAVIVTYPFIESWITQIPPKAIDRVSPHSVTEDFIRLQVEKFLDEMISWEKSDTSYGKIGF